MRTIEPIVRWDVAFSMFCLKSRYSKQTAQISKAISHTGDGHLYLLFAIAALFLDEQSGKAFLMVGLAAFAIELPIYWLAKNTIKRRRPAEFSTFLHSYIVPSDKYSLPSGHSAAAFVMATVIGHFYPQVYLVSLVWASLDRRFSHLARCSFSYRCFDRCGTWYCLREPCSKWAALGSSTFPPIRESKKDRT